jgi:hypothetical protein
MEAALRSGGDAPFFLPADTFASPAEPRWWGRIAGGYGGGSRSRYQAAGSVDIPGPRLSAAAAPLAAGAGRGSTAAPVPC